LSKLNDDDIRVCVCVCVCVCAADVVLIGYDARSMSTGLTNQLSGASNRTALMSAGQMSKVRHSVGILFGFIVRFHASQSPLTSTHPVHLQLWRPRVDSVYQLVCQTSVVLSANISLQVHEVPLY